MKQTLRKLLALLCCLATILSLVTVTASAEETAPAEEPAAVETAEPAEEPAPVETAEPAEEPAPVETAEPAEEPAPVETAEPAEEPAPVETAEPAEEPAPAETAEPAEEPAPVAETEAVSSSQTGWVQKDGNWYYYNEEGEMYQGDWHWIPETDTHKEGYYYFFADGHLYDAPEGWSQVTVDRWGDTDTVWFFGLGGGSLYYGLLEQGGKTYWMAPWMETDSYYWESDTSMRYFDKNGEMLEAKQGWNTYAYTSEYEGTVTKWYYGNGDGTMRTGWLQSGKTWYYLTPWMYDDGVNWIWDDNTGESKCYYFEKSGAMFDAKKGWGQKTFSYDNGSTYTRWYYGLGGGALKEGWHEEGGNKYYLEPWMVENEYRSIWNSDTDEYEYYVFKAGGAMAKNGWAVVSNEYEVNWYYANADGSLKRGWLQSGTEWYYLEPEMVTNSTRTIGDVTYFFKQDGLMAHDGWVQQKYDNEYDEDSDWYYANADGSLKKGWLQSGSKWYYLNPYMYHHGTYQIDGKYYCFNDDGTMMTVPKGWKAVKWPGTDRTEWLYGAGGDTLKTGWYTEGGKTYYLNPWMCYGAHYIDGKYYFFNDSGVLVSTPGWHSYKTSTNTGWVYVNDDGTLYRGWLEQGGKKYYLRPWMVTGIYYENGTRHFFDENGVLTTKPGWHSIKYYYENGATETGWVYLKADGTFYEGWLKDGGRWYYLEEYGVAAIGVRDIDGKNYFFDQNGAMANKAGWQSIKMVTNYHGDQETLWTYTNADGTVKQGWLKEGGRWYYIDAYMAHNGTYNINGTWYFFEKSGLLANTAGWHSATRRINEAGDTVTDWYYTKADGVARTGWIQDGGKWYYMNDYGRMVVNTKRYIDGKWYTFDKNGVWVA